MNNFKKIISFLLICSTVFIKTVDIVEIDAPYHKIETPNFADEIEAQKARIEELKREVNTHQPVSPEIKSRILAKEQPQGIKVTKKLGFFDRVSNWSTKRTLSKTFMDHAKNNDENATGINLDENQKQMWDSLTPEHQKELIEEWDRTHKSEKISNINKNRTKYEQSLDSFKSKIQKDKMAKITKTEKEIKKNEEKIKNIDNDLQKTSTSDSQKRSLELDKEELQEENKRKYENIEKNLTFLKYELDTRDALYRYNDKDLKDYHNKKLNNFIESINEFLDGKITVRKTQKDESEKTLPSESEESINDQIKKIINSSQLDTLTNEEITDYLNALKQEPNYQNDESYQKLSEEQVKRFTYMHKNSEENNDQEEKNLDDLTDEQIRNLSDIELSTMINELVEQNPGSFEYNPEYKKLDAEENRRKNEKRKKENSFVSAWLNDPENYTKINEPFNPSTTESSSEASLEEENLEALKRRAQNWNLDRIKEEMLNPKYSKAELTYLASEAKSLEK